MKCKCIACGAIATRGSMQQPYCQSCFDERWSNLEEYAKHLQRAEGKTDWPIWVAAVVIVMLLALATAWRLKIGGML